MASPAQTAFVNTVPLPPMDPNADPNNILPTGAALSALDPNNPAAVQQPVGSAMDAMDEQEEEPLDDLAAQLAAGRRIRITSKEQWAAMSPHQKEVVRAAMSSGGQIRSGDAVRIYQDSVKRARATQVQTVTLSDGRKVDMINGTYPPAAKQPEPVKRELKEMADGLRSTDPSTGESFLAYDKYSGLPVAGKPDLSATQEDNIKRLQAQSENIGARLDALTNFTESDKVQYDNQNGNYVTTWGNNAPAWVPFTGKTVKEERAEREKEKSGIDKRIEIALRPVRRSSAAESPAPQPTATPSPTPAPTRSAAPQPTPTPTPTPNPMPTPDKFIVGRTYTDANGNKAIYRGNGVFK